MPDFFVRKNVAAGERVWCWYFSEAKKVPDVVVSGWLVVK